MPIFTAQNVKLIALNQDKSRGVSLEFPPDMKTGELLDKTNELRDQVQKILEAELEKEKKDAEKNPEKKEEKNGKIEPIKPEIITEKKK